MQARLILAAAVAVVACAQTSTGQGIVLLQFRPSQPNSPSNLDFASVNRSQPRVDLDVDFANIAVSGDQFRPSTYLPHHEIANQQIFAHRFADCRPPSYRPNPALSAIVERRRATWYSAMAQAACEAGVPVDLFDAMITQESRYDPIALSPKGAAGLAQLMPASASRLGIANVWDPAANLRGGAQLLRTYLDEFDRFDLALAAYNAGVGRVRATRHVPLIPETLHYVSDILTTVHRQFLRNAGALP